jgi:membrane protein YqaA with SNARE-associated domain
MSDFPQSAVDFYNDAVRLNGFESAGETLGGLRSYVTGRLRQANVADRAANRFNHATTVGETPGEAARYLFGAVRKLRRAGRVLDALKAANAWRTN